MNKESTKCLYCGEPGKLAEAHVVPKAFYSRGSYPLILVSKSDARPKVNQTGIYDKNILCADCDNGFGEYDRIALETLKPYPGRQELARGDDGLILRRDDGRPASYVIRNPNVPKLQRFFASLIWKCSVTTRNEMKLVNDGNFLTKADQLLKNPSSNNYFAIIGTRVLERQLNGGVTNPIANDNEYGKFVQFYLAGFIASVFAEPLPDIAPEGQLASRDRWVVGLVSLFETNFHESLQEMQPKVSAATRLFGGRSIQGFNHG